MRIRLYGGPCHGREYEVSGDPLGFRVPKPREAGGWTDNECTEYRNTYCTDWEGFGLFVAPDYTVSLIGDREIEAAAAWIAERRRSFCPGLEAEAVVDLWRHVSRELHRIRDNMPPSEPPEAALAWGTHLEQRVGGRFAYVRLSPGKAWGKLDGKGEWTQIYPS